MLNHYQSSVLLPLVMMSRLMACAENNGISTITATTLARETTPEGAAFAPLIGQRFNEAYRAMVQLPSGLISEYVSNIEYATFLYQDGKFDFLAVSK